MDLFNACKRNLEEPDREVLAAGLRKPRNDDNVTICTVASADSVPLNTDLDPQCYRNLWGAKRVSDPVTRLLVQCNVGCRVIDAENVGFSYGKEVLGSSRWEIKGVCLAIEYFLRRQIRVRVVTPRLRCRGELEGPGAEVIIAENIGGTDDVQVLKQARELNCPWVSRDRVRDWENDLRLEEGLRRWIQEFKALQVRWSWGSQGEFVTDFDLPSITLQPHTTNA